MSSRMFPLLNAFDEKPRSIHIWDWIKVDVERIYD